MEENYSFMIGRIKKSHPKSRMAISCICWLAGFWPTTENKYEQEANKIIAIYKTKLK